MELKLQDVLKEVYQHCLDMQKIAETKNAGLLAFNGAITLSMIKLGTDDTILCYWKYNFLFLLFCSLISAVINMLAIGPRLKHREILYSRFRFSKLKPKLNKFSSKKKAALRKQKQKQNSKKRKKEKQKIRPNLLYFEMIANFSVNYYLEQLLSKYSIESKVSNYEYDLAKQVVINAQITSRKFRLFKRALFCVLIGIATPIISSTLYYLYQLVKNGT